MITVTLTNIEYADEIVFADAESGLIGVAVEGHAIPDRGHAEGFPGECQGFRKGENIICAAVSFGTLNLLRSLTIIAGIRPDYVSEPGFMRLSLSVRGLQDSQISSLKVLFESFLIGMLDLKNENPGFVEIKHVVDTT